MAQCLDPVRLSCASLALQRVSRAEGGRAISRHGQYDDAAMRARPFQLGELLLLDRGEWRAR
jgi:hypothetical protein